MAQFNERACKVALARKAFWDYCKLFAPDFYTEDRTYLREWCDAFQTFYESEEELLIVNAPPRHGKSRTATLFVQWVLGKYPKDKIVTGSYNETLSTVFSKAVRNKIQEIPADNGIVYHEVFSGTRVKRGDAAANLWGIEGNETNSYLATSPAGTVTGFGADLVIIDDLIKSEYEARNETIKDNHWRWFCFTGDTEIATKNGSKKIKDIEDGDRVLTYNHFQCIIEERAVIRTASKKSAIYRLEFEDGRKIESTGNHRFYTNYGYRTVDEIVLIMRDAAEARENVLLSDLQEQGADGATTKDALQILQRRNKNGTRKQTEDVLFCGMQKSAQSNWNQPALRKVAEVAHRNKAGKQLLRPMRGNGKPARSPRGSRYEKQRHSEFDCSMPVVPYKISQITRLPEDDIRTVYDIEVEGNHNFFANGLLAHNCDTLLSRREGKRKIIVVQTRWATDDLAGRLIADCMSRGKQYKLLSYRVYDGEKMLCDDIMNRAQYDDLLNSDMGRDIVEANYNQAPVDMVGRLYTDLQEYDKLPDDIVEIINYTDTADQGDDYLTSIDCAIDSKGIGYLIDVIYTQDSMEKTEPAVAKMITKDNVNYMWVESNNGGRGWGRNVSRIAIEDFRNTVTKFRFFTQTKNKESRILTGSTGVMNRLRFPRGWERTYPEYHRDMIRYQRIGKNAHDDAQDCTTGIYEHLPLKAQSDAPKEQIRDW